LAKFGDFGGVRCHENIAKLRAGSGRLVDPCQHRLTGDRAQDFAGQPGGGEARRDDSEDSRGQLFALARIKYDWNWLCRDVSPETARRAILPAGRSQYNTRAV
jgi:hypothetical protein